MVTAPDFLRFLLDAGFDFFTGVPCSLVQSLIALLEERGGYIPETREDAAIGLAAGASLAGKQPLVIMQNSGLGVCLNALASLSLLYHLPCLLLITWRGYQGKDAPEHRIRTKEGRQCGPKLLSEAILLNMRKRIAAHQFLDFQTGILVG